MQNAKRKTSKQDEALVRALADYQNLIKRTEREKSELLSRANKNIVEDLLPVLDQLNRAQAHLKDQGLEMALEQFKNVLTQKGVETINANPGDIFDVGLHEAVETVEGGKHGTIAKVRENGFKWKDGQVLRPTKVEVYSGEQESPL